MLITGLVVLVLLLAANVFLWRTSISGASFFFVVYRNEDDMKKLKMLSHLAFTISTIGILFLGGLILQLILV